MGSTPMPLLKTDQEYKELFQKSVDRIFQLHELNDELIEINKGLQKICENNIKKFDEYDDHYRETKGLAKKVLQECTKIANLNI
jgi:response regulator of citrate/malate metabolism